MARLRLALFLIALVWLPGCSRSLPRPQKTPGWTAGFWYWQGSSKASAPSGRPVDVLFVHAGSISKAGGEEWRGSAYLPEDVPAAREYWLVFRYESQGVPDLRTAPMIVGEVGRLREEARRRHLPLAGVQLDIDSPTGALARYAGFLREVRKGLPQGFELSITALLDWFRPGTAIAEVIRETDEFVPQFYDVAERGSFSGEAAIAAKIDSARWAPVFNRFQKRFRVGVSTFGRVRFVPKAPPGRTGRLGLSFYGDVRPIDIATKPEFQLQETRNPAGELVLNYRAARSIRMGSKELTPGDTIQFILATPEAVRDATESVRHMGGYVAGVVYFRWPGEGETLTMQPDEVLPAAGLRARDGPKGVSLHVVDGHCAAVGCADVYLDGAAPFTAKPARYRIHSSSEWEYFLPEKNIPVQMAGLSTLEVSLPPYCARGR
ncbi:MAG: DUF3142 domain-containing protein, partial [Acidobacteria bacterium]|nr:DUF3142 domain-containing protein [Acidobacteriota bacterium]